MVLPPACSASDACRSAPEVQVGRAVGEGEGAAGGQRRQQPGDDVVRVGVHGQPVHHRHQRHRHRLGDVEGPAQLFVGEQRVRPAQVGLHTRGAALRRSGVQGPRMGRHDGVVVDVHDAGVGDAGLHHLVQVRRGGDAAADVEELPDARVHEGAGGAADEGAVLPGGDGGERERGEQLRGGSAVRGVVGLAAEQGVVDTGRVRPAGRQAVGRGHRLLAAALVPLRG